MCAFLGALIVSLLGTPTLQAQSRAVASRVTLEVDDTQTVQLKGNVHPFARPEFDRGAVADSQPMNRMVLLLQRGDDQEAALRQLIDAQHSKGSGSYQAWLTPEQFGKQFGPSDADVQAVTDWLARQGFQVAKVAAGRNAIEFNGNVGQVRAAFHTEIHTFAANGGEYFANVSEPAIPQALSPVVKGVVALHNFPKTSQLRKLGEYRREKATGKLTPLFTYGVPANIAMGPADFNTIYNVPTGQWTGSGQSIAVVGQSNINVQDVCDFRTMFGVTPLCPAYSSNNLTIILNGPDPGIVGPTDFSCDGRSSDDEGESDVDVEWAGAIAPSAKIYLVTSQTTCSNPTQVTAGIDLSALYAVDNNVAPVLSESYGGCEPNNLAAGNQFYNALWQQAAAEGITVVVSAGDSGSAGCDSGSVETAATGGLAVNGIASTIYNVSVGGTDFNPTLVPTTPPNQYWSLTNGTGGRSAQSYVPETPWDDSVCATNFPSQCTSVDPKGFDLAGGSGGPSNCVLGVFNANGPNTCPPTTNTVLSNGGWKMPPWQVGVVPVAYTQRTQPDISFFASNNWNGVIYIVCQADANTNGSTSCDLNSPFQDFQVAGGTSFGTPAFAGVMALVNQSQATGQNPAPRQGNANFTLYGLAATDNNYKTGLCNSATPPNAACVFNDIVQAANVNGVQWNNSVACVGGSLNCSQPSSVPFGILVSSNNPAFVAGTGYDLATGLGSVNVANLITKWGTFAGRTATMTTLSGANPTSPVSGASFSVTVNVSGGATGDVSLTALASDGTTVLGSVGPFTLTAGTVTATTTLLPAGAASISAHYGGDVTHLGSTSLPLAFTAAVGGANQPTVTTLTWVGQNADGSWGPGTKGNQNFTYGTALGYILGIAVTNGNTGCGFNYPKTTPTTPVPCPTGTVKLFACTPVVSPCTNGNPLNDFPNGTQKNATNAATLNNLGIAEDQPINLNVGSYGIVANYLGDGNYAKSTSNTLSITLTQASSTTTVQSSLGTITNPPATVQLIATVATTSNADAPCGTADGGTVAFTVGGTAVTGPVTYTAIPPTNTTGAACTATINATVSALLPPIARGTRPTLPLLPLLAAVLSIVLFAIGRRWVPETRRRAYAYAAFVVFALVMVGIAGCGGGGGSSGVTNVTVTANYAGNVNYKTSSNSTTIQVQ